MDDSGIGASARMGIELYEHASRGSGRTHRMVMALPEGATVLYFGPNGDWLRGMVRALRGPEFKVTFVGCEGWHGVEEARHMAFRRRSVVALDHHLIRQIYLRELDRIAERFKAFGVDQDAFSKATQQPPPVAMRWEDRR